MPTEKRLAIVTRFSISDLSKVSSPEPLKRSSKNLQLAGSIYEYKSTAQLMKANYITQKEQLK